MSRYWSELARGLSPYVPGEQPQIADLVKLNTNESPFGPSPLAIEVTVPRSPTISRAIAAYVVSEVTTLTGAAAEGGPTWRARRSAT